MLQSYTTVHAQYGKTWKFIFSQQQIGFAHSDAVLTFCCPRGEEVLQYLAVLCTQDLVRESGMRDPPAFAGSASRAAEALCRPQLARLALLYATSKGPRAERTVSVHNITDDVTQ